MFQHSDPSDKKKQKQRLVVCFGHHGASCRNENEEELELINVIQYRIKYCLFIIDFAF